MGLCSKNGVNMGSAMGSMNGSNTAMGGAQRDKDMETFWRLRNEEYEDQQKERKRLVEERLKEAQINTEVEMDTTRVLRDLFAQQYRKVMANVSSKEAQIVEAEHEAGELSDGESLFEVRHLEAEYTLCQQHINDLLEVAQSKQQQMDNLLPRLHEARRNARHFNETVRKGKIKRADIEPSSDSEFVPE